MVIIVYVIQSYVHFFWLNVYVYNCVIFLKIVHVNVHNYVMLYKIMYFFKKKIVYIQHKTVYICFFNV